MLQAIIRKGKVNAEEIPAPNISKGSLLIKVVNSCISAGTEMSSVASSGKSLIQKALDHPEKIRKALNMLVSEGPIEIYTKIRGKDDPGTATGYSIAGVVVGIGEGVSGFALGDHVAAAGAGIANHAEFVDVPVNLVMKMPQGLSFKDASTVTLGGIALQGVRRADLKIGEFCVVYGAGILGLLSVQMLKISGVRVIVVDLDERRLEIAISYGAEVAINAGTEDPVNTIGNCTRGYGADAVLFTASTSSSDPLAQSFRVCKKKGKVVMVGVSGMHIDRQDMYEKELDLIMSTSYGPGRYDRNYEQRGLDYPYPYVRWTENRNMTEYLRLLNGGQVALDKLIQNVFPISRVTEAFQFLGTEPKPLMVLLDYGTVDKELATFSDHSGKMVISHKPVNKSLINVALVGVGSFATGVHLPNLSKLKDKYAIHAVVNRTGLKAKSAGEKFGAKYSTTNIDDVLSDPDVDLVMICTRHDVHGDLALKTLNAGKHVFVEKPLAVNQSQLNAILQFFNDRNAKAKPLLSVGYNRRFSQYAQEIVRHTAKRIGPLFIRYRMNAGFFPDDSWVHDDGGRIIGECCHIVDLMNFFTGSKIKSVSYESLEPSNSKYSEKDNKSIILKYADGSICTIDYFSMGNKNFPKEYMEIHFDEKTIVMDDYKSLKGFGVTVKEVTTLASDKGQLEELDVLHKALTNKEMNWPIELWDLQQTSEITFLID